MNTWRLDKFEIDCKRNWNDDTVTYKGRIRFINDDFESFDLKLGEETTVEILKLIAPDIAFASSQLTDKLWDNINDKIAHILKS